MDLTNHACTQRDNHNEIKKRSIYQTVAILNVCTTNNVASKYIKKKLKRKKKVDKPTLPFSIIDNITTFPRKEKYILLFK